MPKMSDDFIAKLGKICRDNDILEHLKFRGLIREDQYITNAEALGLLMICRAYNHPNRINYGFDLREADNKFIPGCISDLLQGLNTLL